MNTFVLFVLASFLGLVAMWPLAYAFGLMHWLHWPVFHNWGLMHGSSLVAWPLFAWVTYLILGRLPWFQSLKKAIKGILLGTCTLMIVANGLAVFVSISEWWPDLGERKRLINNGSCDLPVVWYVVLTENEKCLLNSIKGRCNEVDQCFAQCITGGRGNNIGGGCFHLCDRFSGWEPPEDGKVCLGE